MPVSWNCVGCGLHRLVAPSKAARDKNCDKCRLARMVGAGNPRFCDASRRVCQACGGVYRSYQKERKFCSRRCYGERRLRGEAARAAQEKSMWKGGRKDANHKEIVSYLEEGGAQVFDMSNVGRGFPDVLVGWVEKWHLVEIKNPKSAYGRSGLNELQKKFVSEWSGGPVYIIKSKEDVDKFLIGELEPARGGPVATVVDAEGAVRVLKSLEQGR